MYSFSNDATVWTSVELQDSEDESFQYRLVSSQAAIKIFSSRGITCQTLASHHGQMHPAARGHGWSGLGP